jgi:glycosyltransferase involved in cell wall biosynthesis
MDPVRPILGLAVKILLCHNFYQNPGGEDTVFANEGALLESRGHQVIRYQRSNDDIKTMGKLEAFGKTIWNSDTTTDISRLIRSERPDLLHCHNTFPLISPSAYHVAKSMNVAVVQTLHNYRMICPNAQLLRAGSICEQCVGRKLAWPAVAHGCYRNSRMASSAVVAMLAYHRQKASWAQFVDRYIALTQFSRDKFIEGGLPADKIAVKPNFVASAEKPGRGTAGHALFVGRLSPEKGVQTLLDAWKLLPNALPLKIVGDGPMAKTVRAAADRDDRITWLGSQPGSQVQGLMGEARALIMPSIWYEPFGLTMIEAFAMGTPVIASRLGAMSEMVDAGKTGLFFEPGDAGALAKTVQQAIEQPDLLASFRIAARLQYERYYSADENYRQLSGIYEDAIQSSNSSRH